MKLEWTKSVGGSARCPEQSNVTVKSDGEKLDDKEFLVDEYESEEEKSGRSKRKGGGICGGSSSSEGEDEGDEFSDEEEEADFKIYFCSRTHSQLSQFVKELKKTVLADEIKVASLGSRKNLCINKEVMKLGNSTLINERCLDLQKNKKNQVSKMKMPVEEYARQRYRVDAQCLANKSYRNSSKMR
nr:ATP-dependent DNA helicase DDX11 [Tanacetum cinerariifolium]